MMNEQKVRCFLAVAESLNFTEASRRLYISQQAVSKHVADLEAELGLQLFARDHHHVALTGEGARLLTWFTEASASWAALLAELRPHHGARTSQRSQAIRIGYQNWMDFGTAPGHAMNALRKKYPDILLVGERHAPAGLLGLLSEGALDVVLLHRRFLPHDGGFTCVELFDTPMLLVVSAENRLCQEAKGYKAFRGEPLLIDRFEGEPEDGAIRRARREARMYGFSPARVIALPNRDSVYTEAEIGRGVFFGSSMTQMPEGMRLVRYATGINDTICCVWRREEKKRRVRDFAERLRESYRPGGGQPDARG